MDIMADSMNVNEAATTTTFTTPSRKRERGSECSHKVIEKRRRDRINGCLHELSRLVPAARARQGSGKLEKAEILEMTVDYLKKIQLSQDEDCIQGLVELSGEKAPLSSKDQVSLKVKVLQSFRHGYSECTAEVQKYLLNESVKGDESGNLSHLLNHLQLRLNEETAKATITESVNSPISSSTPSQTPPVSTSTSIKKPLQEVSSNNNRDEPVTRMIPEPLRLEPPNKKQQIAPAGCLALPPISTNNTPDTSKINSNATPLPSVVHTGVNSMASIQSQNQQQLVHQPFVPAYALHPSGTHYIPIAIQPGVPMSQIGVGNVGVIPVSSMANSVGMINASPFALVSPGTVQFGAPNGVVHGAMTSTVTSLLQKTLPTSTAEENEVGQPVLKKEFAQSTTSESIATQTEICKDEKNVELPSLGVEGHVELKLVA